MQCPDCRRQIADIASSCRCGWRAAGTSSVNPLGYQQCEWEASGERCKYPGSMSTNTHEGGPYYCREHFGCKDPAWGATVVEASRDYVHIAPGSPEHIAAATRSAQERLKGSGMTRQPGESFEAYRKRSIRFLRDSLQNIGRAA